MKKNDLLDKIIEAKEKIGDKAIKKIVDYYHVENFDEYRKSGCCPFHQEKTPSFIWNDKDQCFTCFSKETKVVTKHGVKEISEIVNSPVEVINGNGKWERVTFVNCGKQKLLKLRLKNHTKEKVIFATPEHEWIVQDRKHKKTTETLKIGDRLGKMWLKSVNKDIMPDPEGMRHGFIYGDGQKFKNTKEGMDFGAYIFDDRKYNFCKTIFDVKPTNMNRHNVKGFVYHISPVDMKKVPSIDSPLEYLFGFLVGYFVADGNCSDDTVMFNSSKKEDLERIRDICTVLGIATYSIGVTVRTPKSNGGAIKYIKEYPLYTMRLVSTTLPNNFFMSEKRFDMKRKYPSSLGYTVVSVEETDRYEDVFCCETSTHSFVLEDFILTGNCFGCGRRVSLLDVYIETEGSYIKAVKRLCEEADVSVNMNSVIPDRKSIFENYKFPNPETNVDRSVVDEYCSKRGISTDTLDYMGVRQDNHGNVTFEMHDIDGTLLCKKYRVSRAVKHGESKMWWDKNSDKCPILYNIDKVDITKPLLITEGFMDAISAVEAGYTNVVSIPGGAEDTNWIEFNYDFLENISEFILWYDNDAAGEGGLRKVVGRLGEYRCKIVRPDKEDEDKVEEYYHLFNKNKSVRKTDANNILVSCGKQRVLNLINNAEEIPSKKLKFLMDCHSENIAEQEKFSMGIEDLDRILYGNLFSCFTIYSGKAGSGKSSVTNTTALISSVENNQKVFVFSGELADGQLADWVVNCFAGYNHVIKIPNVVKDGEPYYVTTKEADTAIRKYYRDKMILYSDDDALDVSGDSLLIAMEEAYKRYGCRVYLIDNLMCIDFEDTNDDKWVSQKKFIIRLMNFTKNHDVCVNLVLHPKKMAREQKDVSTFDLHGASEIGNLCHRMIWVDKLAEGGEGYNTKITVVKDRPTGKAGKSCKLYYDDKTRRFYSSTQELEKEYSWEKSCNIKYDLNVQKNLICNTDRVTSLPNEPSNYIPEDMPF